MKPRTLSFDDGFFAQFHGKVLVVGILMQGHETLEAVTADQVTIDGDDSNQILKRKILEHKPLNAVFLDGSALGGFNIVDIDALQTETNTPVVALTKNKPNPEKTRAALEHVSNTKEKLNKLKANGPIHEHKKLFFHCAGITPEKAKQLIDSTSKNSIPEGLRIAHMVASGITRSVKID